MKNVLVTGGAGFIGSHLCERLTKDYFVTSLDNYSTGTKANHVDGVAYIEGHTEDINELVKFKPDLIFHLGEYSRVEQSFGDVGTVVESNIKGTAEVLEFARLTGAKLVYAGSSTKFGDGDSPYAFTKAKNTELVVKYGEWFGLDYAITYFYNNFGPREISEGPYATLIAKFIQLLKTNEQAKITSPGSQLRNFTHVSDTIDGLLLVAEHGHGDGYGIGNEKDYSVLEIANLMGLKYELVDEKRGNRTISQVHNEKIKDLGWRPKYSLEDYISNKIANYSILD